MATNVRALRTTLRAVLKELRARFYGLKEAAWELKAGVLNAASSSASRLEQWQWRSLLPSSSTMPSIPSFRIPSSFSAAASSGSLRGVAMAPRVLLLALLVLQLIVLAILRASPSNSSHQQPISPSAGSFRTLYSVLPAPAVNKAFVAKNAGGAAVYPKKPLKDENPPGAAAAAEASSFGRGAKANAAPSKHEEEESREESPEDSSVLEGHHEESSPSHEEEEEEAPKESSQASVLAASEAAILEEDPVCKGGRIFVYDLPPMFNADLVANCSVLNPWVSLCDALSNGGLGKPMPTTPWPASNPSPWFFTEQFSGEVLFHTRILAHPCVTNDSNSANIFYVPFYAGLDVSRYLWKPSDAQERDALGRKLVEWLGQQQPFWARRGGLDHFMMIGRITWDFRRTEDKAWGSGFLHIPEIKNITRLVIECNPWEGGEFGIPYPTSFHPRSEKDLEQWQGFLRTKERSLLFSFAGATRRRIPNDFRLELLVQCSDSGSSVCSAMDCSESKCERPEPVMQLFLNSTFCLQPRGDSYTRRSIFDAMVAGCIPVFFWNQTSYWQYRWFFPSDDESYSVFIDKGDVRSGKKKIREVLEAIPAERVRKMRDTLIEALPKLVYATPDHQLPSSDAFDTSIDGVLRYMLKMNLRSGGLQRSSI